MKKKAFLILCSLCLVASALTGCSSGKDKEKGDDQNSQEQAPPEEQGGETSGEENSGSEDQSKTNYPEVSEGGLATGLAVISGINKSVDAGEDDGLAQIESTIVAVTLTADGKIAECKIDSVLTKINFSSDGKLTTDLNTRFPSKNELGEQYGMKEVSSIDKEWNEQAAAFAEYVKGKTVEEVKGIAVNDNKAPEEGTDLASTVTISIGDFQEGLEKAVSSAADLGAKEGDKLGIGSITHMEKSKDASQEEDGMAEAYSNYAALTMNPEGRITSCILDASQGDVFFDNTGLITSDLDGVVRTKNELGEDYGMKEASTIGKEWNEQAKAYGEYVVGKTLDEVNGISLGEEGNPTETDLTASVTISVGVFNEVIGKAVENAQ